MYIIPLRNGWERSELALIRQMPLTVSGFLWDAGKNLAGITDHDRGKTVELSNRLRIGWELNPWQSSIPCRLKSYVAGNNRIVWLEWITGGIGALESNF